MQPAFHSQSAPLSVKFDVSEARRIKDQDDDEQEINNMFEKFRENENPIVNVNNLKTSTTGTGSRASNRIGNMITTQNSNQNLNSKSVDHGSVVILKEPTHACFACPKAFNHKWMLDRHILTHTGEQPFACSICLRRFSLQASCLRHVRHVHKDVSGLIGNYVVKVNELQQQQHCSENIQS